LIPTQCIYQYSGGFGSAGDGSAIGGADDVDRQSDEWACDDCFFFFAAAAAAVAVAAAAAAAW
jgi:hypothetical protein